jgi:two-component system response regulator GlrR
MTSRKPAHLLLVDDDPGLLKLLGMRLVSEGYSVVTAESGQEGLKALGREKIDLVISDPEAAARNAGHYTHGPRLDS